MKKKVMVLGAGRGQIPLINLCHKYGAIAIAVSPNGNYPGFDICDESFYEDIKNKESILRKAQELSIDAIVTDQLDQSVPTVAYVAEKMNLPGITYDIARKFTDKFYMRQSAKVLNINVPCSFLLCNLDDVEKLFAKENIVFPQIMKPVDGSASNGIFKVNSKNEIKEYFDYSKKYSKTGGVILEQFIDGDEFVVEAYTHDYNVCNLMVGHRDYFNVPKTFIPGATVFQDANHVRTDLEKKLLIINQKIIHGFGLKFGITHGEYLVEKSTGKIYLVEIAARGGGVFISSEIIPAATGVNANELLLKDALGIYDDEINIQEGAAAYFCYLLPNGIVTKIEGIDKASLIPGVKKAFFDNVALGMKIDAIRDKSSRKGPIIVQGRSKEDCYRIIEKVKSTCRVNVESNGLVYDALWSSHKN